MYILCGAKCCLYGVDGARRAEIGVACRSPLSPVLPPAGGADDRVHWIWTCAPKGEGLITREAIKYYRSAFSYAGHTLGWNVCTSLVFLCAIPMRCACALFVGRICRSFVQIKQSVVIVIGSHPVLGTCDALKDGSYDLRHPSAVKPFCLQTMCERSDVWSFLHSLQTNFRSSVGSSPWNRRGAGLAFR